MTNQNRPKPVAMIKLNIAKSAVCFLISLLFRVADGAPLAGASTSQCNAPNPFAGFDPRDIAKVGVCEYAKDIEGNQVRIVDYNVKDLQRLFSSVRTGNPVWLHAKQLLPVWDFYIVFFDRRDREIGCVRFENSIMPTATVFPMLIENDQSHNRIVPPKAVDLPPKTHGYGFQIPTSEWKAIFEIGRKAGIVRADAGIGDF
jgi:hypothetical protein